MNIHGYKLKIRELQQELKKGKDKLGSLKFNRLQKRKNFLQGQIKRLRREKEERKKKK